MPFYRAGADRVGKCGVVAGWWRAGLRRDVSGGLDVGLAAQVPYWSEDVVASGGRGPWRWGSGGAALCGAISCS